MADGERTALKEWAVLVDALARGDIITMVRKGGIREQRAGFEVRHQRFLFYPTFFHENRDHLAERFLPTLAAAHAHRPAEGTVRIAHLAEVLAVWNVTDATLLQGIAHEHGLAAAAVQSRFDYRGTSNVRVVAVRMLELPQPIEIPETKRYGGCVSWLELDVDIMVEGSRPVVGEKELQYRLETLGSLLDSAEREAP